MSESTDPCACWNDPMLVARFRDREPDVRLQALVDDVGLPACVRVLDLGCAGGRNTEMLARAGFDVTAVDASEAMIATVRERLASVLGEAEAQRRVVRGAMRDLGRWPDGAFHLVVALGIFHQAQSEEEWSDALSEAARVLAPGGRILVANFAPGTGAVDAPHPRIEGTRFLHHGSHQARLALREQVDLEADLAAVGLLPETPSEVVERTSGDRRRVTVNGLFRKTA